MKVQGIVDFRAPPPIPTFIDTSLAIDELPPCDSFEPPVVRDVEPSPDDFNTPPPQGREGKRRCERSFFATYLSRLRLPRTPRAL
jgi:hypothetical protein